MQRVAWRTLAQCPCSEAFPLPVRPLRYVLLTALGAGLVWASVLSMVMTVDNGAMPFALRVAAGLATALFGLAAIGTAQWLELRHHTSAAHGWILWTALGWALALPWSFTATPFVDESTPIASRLVLWSCAGLLMAHVMALIKWQAIRRLPALAYREHEQRDAQQDAQPIRRAARGSPAR
jgi:hypothetical protein